jgi:PKD repeat protein
LCNAPSVASKKDSFNCGTGTVNLEATASTGGTIKWYANATGGAALVTGNSFTTPSISATTTYYVAAASGTCESSPRTAVIASIRTVPTVNIGNDTTICPGVSYTMNATTAGAAYGWNTGATTPTLTVNAAGTYSVLVTVNGCGGSDARVITPGVVPVNNLVATTNLCSGETVTLNAGNTGSTFTWTPGSATTQTINVTLGGTYSVVVKSVDGCKITSSTNVIIRPLPVAVLGNDTNICKGDHINLDAGNAGYNFLWNTGATTQVVNASDSGTYHVTITSPFNCVREDEIHVGYLPSPYVEGFNFIPMFYDQLGKVKFSPLNPTSVTSYLWDFGDGSATSVQVNPTHVYASAGNYTVTLTVFNGCSQFTTSLVINVDLTTGMVTLTKDYADVMIYPNPSDNFITIDCKNDNVKMKDIMVFNALGAVVYKQKADSYQSHQFTVSGLASGVYSVRIVTDKGYINRKFVVKR